MILRSENIFGILSLLQNWVFGLTSTINARQLFGNRCCVNLLLFEIHTCCNEIIFKIIKCNFYMWEMVIWYQKMPFDFSFYKKILIDYASYVINKYFYFIFIKMLQYLRHTFGSVRRFLVSLWHSARLLLLDYRLDY